MQQFIIFILFCIFPHFKLSAATTNNVTSTISLQQRLNSVNSLEGNFKQEVIENNKILQKSSGKFYLQRKDKFRWQAQSPSKQLIVSNGQTIWVYDEELEQVSIKPVDENSQSTPIFLLNGSQATLDKHYHISILTKKNQVTYHLVPNTGLDNGYLWIDLIYMDNNLSIIQLKDKLEQITKVSLTKVKINNKLSPELFTFTPPKGVDIVS